MPCPTFDAFSCGFSMLCFYLAAKDKWVTGEAWVLNTGLCYCALRHCCLLHATFHFFPPCAKITFFFLPLLLSELKPNSVNFDFNNEPACAWVLWNTIETGRALELCQRNIWKKKSKRLHVCSLLCERAFGGCGWTNVTFVLKVMVFTYWSHFVELRFTSLVYRQEKNKYKF